MEAIDQSREGLRITREPAATCKSPWRCRYYGMSQPDSQTAWDRLYIDGEWRDAGTSETIPVTNPATIDDIAAYPLERKAMSTMPIRPPRRPSPTGRRCRATARNEYSGVIGVMQERLDEIVELLATESGVLRPKRRRGQIRLAISTLMACVPPEEAGNETTDADNETVTDADN